MSRPVSRPGWDRLFPTAHAEIRLFEWLEQRSEGERTAFWTGALLADGAVSVAGIVEGWALVLPRPPAVIPDPDPEVTDPEPERAPVPCAMCGALFVPVLPESRSQRFCSRDCRWRWCATTRADRRRAAKADE